MVAQDSLWQKEYYQKNKERISERKKKRYQGDPEFRERVKVASKEFNATRLKVKREKIAQGLLPARKPRIDTAKEYRIMVGQYTVTTKMHTSRVLGRCLGRQAQTIRLWERNGILPCAMYRTSNGLRLYTDFQVRKLVDFYREVIREFGISTAENRISSTNFTMQAAELWREFPSGVDLSEAT
jgi:hypothetical protein